MTDGTADLDIAIELVNTEHDLARPTSIADFQAALGGLGQSELARQLRVEDRDRVVRLQARLRPVFAAPTAAAAAALLNPMLRDARTSPQLVEGPGGTWDLRAGVGLRGVEALEARLPAALAEHVAAHGVDRLGVCHAPPCRFVYVDRTRPGTRRYCSDQCNDRAAAAAYRRRRRPPATTG